MSTTYFNIEGIKPIFSYVLLLDIMGTQNIMGKSITTSSNFIFKFHTILEMNKDDTIAICPIMDGAYIGIEDATIMQKFINNVFNEFCNDFINEEDFHHRYIVRGSLAYGKVVFGKDIPINNFDNSLKTKLEWENYRKSLIIGHPLIQAYSTERNAPPFGIFVHESVSISDFFKTYRPNWYKWWNDKNTFPDNFKDSVKSYFDEYKKYPYSSGYDNNKIEEHTKMFDEYINL
jgi:hypothetical protein